MTLINKNKSGALSYDPALGKMLKGISWKDINQKFENDFDKALEYILSSKLDEERKRLADFVQKVDSEIIDLDLGLLGKKTKPPEGY